MKTAEEILKEVYQDKEDLQLAITLNPDKRLLIKAMKKYALEALKEDRNNIWKIANEKEINMLNSMNAISHTPYLELK